MIRVGSDEGETDEATVEPLDLRRVGLSLLASLFGLMALIYGAGLVFREQLIALSEWFVERLGGPGIFLGYLVPDTTTLPVPADAFTLFGVLGGMPFWEVVAWGSAGSLSGGCIGWVFGRWVVARSPRLQATLDSWGPGIMARVQRGGTAFLALAAVTPIPYSLTCYASGAVGMPFGRFFAVSLLRILRVGGYLWLFHQGLVHL